MYSTTAVVTPWHTFGALRPAASTRSDVTESLLASFPNDSRQSVDCVFSRMGGSAENEGFWFGTEGCEIVVAVANMCGPQGSFLVVLLRVLHFERS